MTDTLPDSRLPHLLKACETHPDPVLFARIGDVYDECGDEKMAFAWHWMARKGKWPAKWKNGRDKGRYVWSYFDYQGKHHVLPLVIADSKFARDTFLAAVEWLADRLEEVRAAL